ncbi:hypothetical protein AAFF_G00221800 [Aldrovandia affinis]|uniref:Uncharacterized protein n=1 Tax=Aldrovandia affinis TaxID=143900 RepID=A0AAD7RFY1_9TELE|nr:hypothetical protein AAFF_G00221800 [Aldrovandia affinis]
MNRPEQTGHRPLLIEPGAGSEMASGGTGGAGGERSPTRTWLVRAKPSPGGGSPGSGSPRVSPRNSPRHSPRDSPRHSPRNSPLLFRRLLVSRNIGQQRRFTLAHTPSGSSVRAEAAASAAVTTQRSQTRPATGAAETVGTGREEEPEGWLSGKSELSRSSSTSELNG